ncbi:hypothetical protein GCM10025865_21720 [Paraoerskovia sediminicola]|uniref:GP-PDE domain-containing protein n=1 Tax=Paraoerskovia sediminicola TaxID=1138587 RepID=A0ABN6XFK8_9CELL|nr:hypothetical protein [Paraoerskovia sediminicola]BDZ42873.1 hypothetical protein GCM10025865_21720 [Paraoerskovia sediminicola]
MARASTELRGITRWCRENDVPTVFWNKEDPVHFDLFVATAALFDVVFTTDVDSIPGTGRSSGTNESSRCSSLRNHG